MVGGEGQKEVFKEMQNNSCQNPFEEGGSGEAACWQTLKASAAKKPTGESLTQSSFVFSHQKCVHSGFRWTRCHSIRCGQMISIGFLCCFRKSCFVAILSSRDQTLSWSTPWKKWRKFEETKSIQPTRCCPHWATAQSVLLRRVLFLSSPAKETYWQDHGEVKKIRGFLRAEIKVTRFFHVLLSLCHWVMALVQTQLPCTYARAGAWQHELQFSAKCGCLLELFEAGSKSRGKQHDFVVFAQEPVAEAAQSGSHRTRGGMLARLSREGPGCGIIH